jgi:hypothetical protein
VAAEAHDGFAIHQQALQHESEIAQQCRLDHHIDRVYRHHPDTMDVREYEDWRTGGLPKCEAQVM